MIGVVMGRERCAVCNAQQGEPVAVEGGTRPPGISLSVWSDSWGANSWLCSKVCYRRHLIKALALLVDESEEREG